jgi:hypothetical protein
MLKSIIVTASVIACNLLATAQNYSFVPGAEYYGTLEMDMYTEHYMFIGHDLQDSAYITWRLVENTCPEEWDIQACDYQHCYTGLPNYGDMNGVAPGAQGNLRMIVNPFLTPGSGMLHFLIYPTGEPLNYTDAYFFFNTTALSISPRLNELESVITQSKEILYTGPMMGPVYLYDVSGKCIASEFKTESTHRISMSDLPGGMFILKTPTGNSFRIAKPH